MRGLLCVCHLLTFDGAFPFSLRRSESSGEYEDADVLYALPVCANDDNFELLRLRWACGGNVAKWEDAVTEKRLLRAVRWVKTNASVEEESEPEEDDDESDEDHFPSRLERRLSSSWN